MRMRHLHDRETRKSLADRESGEERRGVERRRERETSIYLGKREIERERENQQGQEKRIVTCTCLAGSTSVKFEKKKTVADGQVERGLNKSE